MKATEEQLWQIIQASPVAMVIYDSNGIFYKLNDMFVELFGYTSSDLPHVDDWFPRAYPDETYRNEVERKWFAAVEKYLETGEKFVPIEARVTCKDGTVRDIEFKFSSLDDIYITTFVDLTPFNKIYEKLRESEQRYRALFEGSRDGIVMISVDRNIIDANQAYCDMLGYSLEELKKKNLDDVTPLKWRKWEQVEIIEKQLLTRGFSDTYEKEYIHRDGTIFPIELETYRFENVETGEFFLWGAVRDISERKKVKEALRESEERFRKLSSLSFEGILIHKDAKYIDSNLRFQKMFGYEPKELAGVDLIDMLISPETQDFVRENVKLEHAKPYEAEVVHKNGKILPVEIEAHNISWEGKKFRVAAFRNITERKRAEKIAAARLAILEYSYNCTLNELLVKTLDEAEKLTNSSVGFFHFIESDQKTIVLQAWSTNTTKNMCNAEGETHYDIERAGVWTDCIYTKGPVIHNEYESLPYRKGLPEGHVPIARELLFPVIRNNLIVAIIGVGNKLSGYDEYDIGMITQLSDLAWDIAVRKKIEDALVYEIQEKERIQHHLTQAQKMEAIGTLAGGIAHDFNNILSGMMGSIEILGNVLGKEVLTNREKIEKYLSILKKASLRGADIVKQLLTLSRKQDSHFTQIRLNDSLHNIYEIARNSFPKSVDIIFNIPEDDIFIEADETQINQALLNLCVNASHAMTVMRSEGEKEGGTLTVEIMKIDIRDSPGIFRGKVSEVQKYFKISVTDTGVGMDEVTVNQIFDPFFTTKNKEEGTGLGLAMVYGILKKHNGFINVNSEKGKGTTFSVYLPEYSKEKKEITGIMDNREKLIGKGNVLIIDDEEDILAVAEEMLFQRGFTVVTAVGAEEGIETYRKYRETCEAVILDLSMPKKTGLEVFRELREINPSVKVLMSSGFAMDERIQKAIELGAMGFIKKPYSINEVIGRLNKIINE